MFGWFTTLMNNLFINIQKYRPRENRNSLEDFFTEVLAFVLNELWKSKNKEALINFLKLLEINITEINEFMLSTRANYSLRPDIEIIINNQIQIFMENKVEAEVGEYELEINDKTKKIVNQLEEYWKIQKNGKYKEHYLILLSQYYEEINDNLKDKVKQIYWKDVYVFFKELKTESEVVNFLVQQFLELMEEMNMTPYEGISKELFERYNKFLDNINKLTEEVGNKLGESYPFKSFNINNHKFSFYFNRERKGNVFCLKLDNKTLAQKQIDNLKNIGCGSYKNWGTWLSFSLDDNFFNLTANEQVDQLTEWYKESLEKMKSQLINT